VYATALFDAGYVADGTHFCAVPSIVLRADFEVVPYKETSVDEDVHATAGREAGATASFTVGWQSRWETIDPARKQWHRSPPISAKDAEMDGAHRQYLVAGSIKPKFIGCLFGTAEAVPFQDAD
jgi:hypothetical protein